MRSKYRMQYRLGTVVLATLGLAFLSSSVASAQTAPRTKTVAPDYSYYAGKTVTFLTGGAPGAANDEAALIIAPLMASYLHCAINVVDMPTGATVPAQEATAASQPNGLTFGQGGPVGDIESQDVGQNDINFPLRTQAWIGSFSPPQYVIAVTASSGIKTLAQFLKPTNGHIKFLTLTGGGSLNEQVLDGVFKLHAQFVTGYTNVSTLLAGFLRGDGNASIINAPSTAPYIVAGQFRALALTQTYVKGEVDYSVMSKIPVLSAYLAAHPPKTKQEKQAIKILDIYNAASDQDLFAPAGTPPKYVAALSAAFRSAVHQPGAQAQLIQQGVPNGYNSGPQTLKLIDEMIKDGPAVTPYLGGAP